MMGAIVSGSGRIRAKPARRRAAAAALVSLSIAGCSADSNLDTGTPQKRDLGLTRPEWTFFAKDDAKNRAIRPEDLLGADGRCAGEAAASPALNFQAGPSVSPAGAPASGPAGGPPVQPPRGIGLEMSECEVARIAGYTDKFEITTNERGQRSVVLTFLRGDHVGIYHFVNGRLKSIERAPEAAAPPKSKKAGK